MVDEEAHTVGPHRDQHMVQVLGEARTTLEHREAHVAEEDSKQPLSITSNSQGPTVVEEAEAEEEELQATVRINPGVRTTLLTTVLQTRLSLLVLTVVVMTTHNGTVEVKGNSKKICWCLLIYQNSIEISNASHTVKFRL